LFKCITHKVYKLRYK